MKLLITLFFILNAHAAAASDQYHCEIKYNLQTVYTTSFSIADSQTVFFSSDSLEMTLHRQPNQRMMLEIYDRETPARLYSYGVLREEADVIGLSTWNRDAIMDVLCGLESPKSGTSRSLTTPRLP